MSLITRCQTRVLTYWPRIGTQRTGEPIWGAPTEYTCRWDDKIREIIGPQGTKVMSSIEVITEVLL